MKTLTQVCILAAVVLAGQSMAQVQQRAAAGARPAAGAAGAVVGESVRLIPMEFVRLSRLKLLPAPSIGNEPRKGRGKPREWALFEVGYETAPEWIDELEFNFTVMMKRLSPETGREEYNLFRTTVKYVDVIGVANKSVLNSNMGRHQSCVALHPNAFIRYGDERDNATRGVVAFALEIVLDGKVVAAQSEVVGALKKSLPEDWWKNPVVTNNDAVQVRDGYLMDRSKTPFALMNSDDYEMVKQ